MKLAEALILRADCQKRLEQLKARIVRSAKVQEGDAPPENPQELVTELERTASELMDLIKRINRTNSMTRFESEPDERATLSDVLAERDVLAMRRAAYSGLAEAAAVTQNLYSRSDSQVRQHGQRRGSTEAYGRPCEATPRTRRAHTGSKLENGFAVSWIHE